MKDREKYIELYSLYKNLLTETEIKYFEYYYYEDYSYTEIAELIGVSKVYVGKMITKNHNKLLSFEDKLNLLEKRNKIIEISNSIKEEDIKSKLQEII